LRTLVIPAIFSLASALMIGNALYRAPKPSLIGLFLIVAGIPLFVFSRRRNAECALASSSISNAAMDQEGG
jgi:hypothetical protein